MQKKLFLQERILYQLSFLSWHTAFPWINDVALMSRTIYPGSKRGELGTKPVALEAAIFSAACSIDSVG